MPCTIILGIWNVLIVVLLKWYITGILMCVTKYTNQYYNDYYNDITMTYVT